MKFSKSFIPTTKQPPKDAVVNSHKYLVQGGFVSQTGSGIYNFLPMGKIVLDQISTIVKEELNKTGAQEVDLGMVTPASLWKESARYEKYGKELLRFKDRKSNDFVLGPTYEEAMVDLVRNRVTSYKNLPLNLYQVKTKFRDELRPRFGLLRGREFLMKDGYSFHSSEESLKEEFALMEQTYKNILDRLGLEYRVVEADSGSIGGNSSKEFMVLASNGEDDIVYCEACEYGANIEAAVSSVDNSTNSKIVVKKALYEDSSKIVVFFISQDDELQLTKATKAVDALELFDIDTPQDMTKQDFIDSSEYECIIDSSLENEFALSSYDVRAVQVGDTCKCCGNKLNITKGIEVGHIFELGDKYSSALNATFLDENGKSKNLIMGTYGLGISRLVAVMQEVLSDEKGCVWNNIIAPCQLDIIISDIKKPDQVKVATDIYNKCLEKGLSVILDDRKERFGFKIGDFELIGFPYAIIVGRNLSDGIIQLVDRKTLQKTDIQLDEIDEKLKELFWGS
ncbi:MAG: Prolyl-tRNA synthetase (EC, bacterial type [uncultured Campylobacterales bacterium]|uniref:Proline--tRNA ligase n=1 Tax=uncultured Campylobacterales bacterium TaxID=352960 RepID=A0A6S6T5U1_9BACT|nr:MAG: Prolyl-tRNA synthetase (EC, bacterial type [uncultured Campylobacterales bacterium]